MWYMMKRSRQAHQQNRQEEVQEHFQPGKHDDVRAHYASQDGQYQQNEYYKPTAESPPVEAPGSIPGRMYSDHGRVEADSGEQVRELPGDVPRDTPNDKPQLR